jgi:ABC-type branched-subunit amino acid transport system substrate-binding protein
VKSVEIAPFGTTDWAPYIAKLKASGAAAVLLAVSWGAQYTSFVQQAMAQGLYDSMQVVAPVGFPDEMLPGYGADGSEKTVQALQQTKVLAEFGGSWTFESQYPDRKKFNQLYYDMYKHPPTTQANLAMASAWMLFDAMNKAGTDPQKLMEALTTESFQTPYSKEALKVQPDGRQVEMPMYATKLVKLPAKQYGVDYANETLFTMPSDQVVDSAADLGCTVKKP